MKIPRYLICVVWCVTLAGAAFALEPVNLTSAKEAVTRYVNSGEYQHDLDVMARYAQDWVTARAARKAEGEKLALVLDIDETALSNLTHMQEMDFGYVPVLWDEWVANHHAPAIESVRTVYQLARRLDVAVFFITGRREKDRPGTESNLRAAGYGEYAQLIFKSNESHERSQEFKTTARENIRAAGWTIIANVGDQQSDLDGGSAERTFKLPNPFYLIK